MAPKIQPPPLAGSTSGSLSGWLARLALLLFGLLLPLLMLESGVRLLGLAPPPTPNPTIWEPHPLFGWWHIPTSGGTFHSDFNEFTAEVWINARGLRDREISYDNPSGAVRILSLADSFGEAIQVNLEQTYHKQLEKQLAGSLARPVEVINAGAGGWGTDQEAIFYVAEGFRYEPEVVLLAFFIRNDAVNNYGPLEIERNGGRQQKEFFSLSPGGALIPPPVQETLERTTLMADPQQTSAGLDAEAAPPLLSLSDTLWSWSALYRLVMPYLRDIPAVVKTIGPSGLLGGEAVIRADHPSVPIPFYVYQDPPDERFAAAWALTEAIISRLNDEVAARGSRLAVVLIGAPEQIDSQAWQRTLAANPAIQPLSLDLEAPNRRLTAFLEAKKIPHLDLAPIFRRAAGQPDTPPLHFRHDQHWTPAGHRLAAEAIHEFLQRDLGMQLERESLPRK
jgi:hypothetical protein